MNDFLFLFNIKLLSDPKLEGASQNSTVIKYAESDFSPAIVTLAPMSMKTFVLIDFNALLDRHNEAVVSTLVKTDNKLNIRRSK